MRKTQEYIKLFDERIAELWSDPDSLQEILDAVEDNIFSIKKVYDFIENNICDYGFVESLAHDLEEIGARLDSIHDILIKKARK